MFLPMVTPSVSLFVYPSEVFVYQFLGPSEDPHNKAWGHCGGDTADAARPQNSLSFHGCCGMSAALLAGTQGIFCLPAKSGFQVPYRNLGYGWMGVARPCEGSLFVTGGSLEGGCG